MYEFPLEKDELILRKSLASLNVDGNAFNGAMYLTNERIVFVGYLLDISNKYLEEVPLPHVEKLEPATSLWLIQNAIILETIKGRSMKFVVKGRNAWLDDIEKQMKNIAG